VTRARWRGTSGSARPALCLLAALVVAACGPNGGETRRAAPSPAPSPSPSITVALQEGSDLLRSLRSGGLTIYFRHAATVPGSDADLENLDNCPAQRNLSDLGREQAQVIGEAFRRLEIPVGRVLSSRLCRCRDTATIAFGRAEQSLDITSLPQASNEAEKARRTGALRQLLATPPPSGQNTVLVAHLFNVFAAAETNLAEGEAAIFEPLGGEQFRLVAKVTPDEWDALAERP
jgi:phosphohistidine phosphatase SixA